MVRISRKKIKPDTLDKIYQLLFEIMAKKKNKVEFLEIFEEIFTPTEKIMIAKRVVIIYLLIKEVPQKDIATALGASVGTVSRYAILLESKESKIRQSAEKLILKEQVFNIFDDIFHNLFISPGIYKGHWKIYKEYLDRKERRTTSGL